MTVRNKRIDLRASQKDEQNLQAVAAKLKTRTITETVFKAVEAVAEDEPELFLVDREKIQILDEMSEFGKKHFQAFIDEFRNVTGWDIEIKQLQKIFKHTGSLGSTAKLQNEINIVIREGQFARMQAKYPDLVLTFDNIPNLDISKLLMLAEEMGDMPVFIPGHKPIFYWHTFELKDGKINVLGGELEKLKNAYRHYAETPEEKRKLSLVRKLCQALNAVNETGEINPDHINKLFYYDPIAARFEPSGGWIKYSVDPYKLIEIEIDEELKDWLRQE